MEHPSIAHTRLDQQQLLDNGYLVLRNLIVPSQLEQLRRSIETMVEQRKTRSAANRQPNEPPGGAWEVNAQPRLKFEEDFDEATVNTIEFCLQEDTLGVSNRLMGAPETAVTYMACMCSPMHDHGPASWHRDVAPAQLAPLRGLQMNTLTYGPTYLQWNIALYDDSVFWVVPGSHRRVTTEVENGQLSDNPRVPLPGGTPVELQAGDGVVYTHLLLHWGSNYSTTLRRTIHLGYRAFGAKWFSVVHWRHWEPTFFRCLSSPARQKFEMFTHLFEGEFDLIASIFRAMIDMDSEAFEVGLRQLHPGEKGRMVSVVMLSKLAFKMQRFTHLAAENLPPDERIRRLSEQWPSVHDFDRLVGKFSSSDVDQLCQRFRTLDEKLKLNTMQEVVGLQGGETQYNPHDMPADFEVDDFIASW
ncbi:MAG: phytanoyl-CoA dioxygenase family protein [Candidatus Latescibacteria bacterium]|nr:phytanoyl-CoA dioxygenase family protein [Candidatus Latescibacterota bacterium]